MYSLAVRGFDFCGEWGYTVRSVRPFEELAYLGQIRKSRQIALAAIGAYRLTDRAARWRPPAGFALIAYLF